MNLYFNINLGNNYKNNSQKIRVLTENWISDNLYCPKCGNLKIEKFPNNTPVADFFCTKCYNQYELKSKNGINSTIIVDGAYDTMIERITSNSNPDFLFLTYTENKVNNLSLIPKHFFTPEIIIKRSPLSKNAKRAGWIGCNIDCKKIPIQGYIPIIKNGVILDKNDVVKSVIKAEGLKKDKLENRGWLFDVLNCVNAINGMIFQLEDIYKFESFLSYKYPKNNNIKAKIRQQLQFLRDKGYIKFLGNGFYSKI